MRRLSLASGRALVAVTVAATLTVGLAHAQTGDSSVPRAPPWGAPALQGVWDFRSLTPFERPVELAGKTVLTDEAAASVLAEANETWRGHPGRKPGDADWVVQRSVVRRHRCC